MKKTSRQKQNDFVMKNEKNNNNIIKTITKVNI